MAIVRKSLSEIRTSKPQANRIKIKATTERNIRRQTIMGGREPTSELNPSKGQLTGMKGVYLVAAELAGRGFIVSPTSRSAAGADLLVTDTKCRTAFSIQVKTNARSFSFFLMGKRAMHLTARSHVYVLVNLKPKATEYFVVPSYFAAKRVKVFHRKTGSVWYAIYREDIEKFRDAWEIFGRKSRGN